MAVQVSNAFEFHNVIFEIEHLQNRKSDGYILGTEQDVKTLWLNILGHIFPSSENFGYGRERHHVAGSSDFMVFKYGRYVDRKFRVHLLLVEAKGLDKDNAADWTSAEHQLEAYGVDMPNSSDLTYGAIPIGLCVAFLGRLRNTLLIFVSA